MSEKPKHKPNYLAYCKKHKSKVVKPKIEAQKFEQRDHMTPTISTIIGATSMGFIEIMRVSN